MTVAKNCQINIIDLEINKNIGLEILRRHQSYNVVKKNAVYV